MTATWSEVGLRVGTALRRSKRSSAPMCPRCGFEVRLGWPGPLAIEGVRAPRTRRELLKAHCPRHGQAPYNGI